MNIGAWKKMVKKVNLYYILKCILKLIEKVNIFILNLYFMILSLLSGITYAIKVIISIGYTCIMPACEKIITGFCL